MAEEDIKEMKHEIDHGMKNTADNYLERYTTQILDSMHKNQKFELMQFMKIKPSTNLDLKSKILKEYNIPDKGGQFKNIDSARMQLESTIKHMPMSIERQTMLCRNDIAQCKNLNELKTQLRKNQDGDESPRRIAPPVLDKKGKAKNDFLNMSITSPQSTLRASSAIDDGQMTT